LWCRSSCQIRASLKANGLGRDKENIYGERKGAQLIARRVAVLVECNYGQTHGMRLELYAPVKNQLAIIFRSVNGLRKKGDSLPVPANA